MTNRLQARSLTLSSFPAASARFVHPTVPPTSPIAPLPLGPAVGYAGNPDADKERHHHASLPRQRSPGGWQRRSRLGTPRDYLLPTREFAPGRLLFFSRSSWIRASQRQEIRRTLELERIRRVVHARKQRPGEIIASKRESVFEFADSWFFGT